MKKASLLLLLAIPGVFVAGCGSSDDGGDPTKAPRVEEVKPPEGWVPPDQRKSQKSEAGKARMAESTDGEPESGR